MKNMKIYNHRITLVLMTLFFILESCSSVTNKTIYGEPSAQLWDEDSVYERASVPVLIKNQDEDFRILLFSDIQLDSGLADDGTLILIDLLVEEIKPDMIMTTGDNTAWILAHDGVVKLVRQIDAYGIPWGVTLGNHDSEGQADRIWHGNQYEQALNSIFISGPSNIQGIGNYSVIIEDEEGKIRYALVMMDSNETRTYEVGTDYDYIYPDQIKWYSWLISGINSVENRIVPSMLFFHIPLPEFKDAANLWKQNEPAAGTFGEIRENICCPPVNTGLFDSILDLQSTTHIFCGHDHVNNLSTLWKGVRLTYGLKTGSNSYSDDDMQGATLITVKAGTNEVAVEHIFK